MESTLHFLSSIPWWAWIILFFAAVAIHDITQHTHTIKHNFPIVGRLRYWIETVGPEFRQYIVASNREELPFNRRSRSWTYASSKRENNFQGFGADQDIHSAGYIFIKPALPTKRLPKNHPYRENPYTLPSAKVIGLSHNRKKPYRPKQVINISDMSFGSLSGAPIEALNKGAAKFGCYHNTGEGGFSPYHNMGGDVVLNIGTAYFGIRDDDGNFVMQKLINLTQKNPSIRMIELKLPQGAKAGKGGMLPGSKITKEIAEIRHVPIGKDVISPAAHSALSNIAEMLDFIEAMAEATGLPVGIKAAVGKLDTWEDLAQRMAKTGRDPDFITIDGGEGGTGAAPPSFADHVSLPWVYGFSSMYKIFKRHRLTDRITFIGSGKLGLLDQAVMAFAMGADVINVAREAMMSIGCIQAQVCHTNRCPTGVSTQNKWLQSGLDPALKSERFHNYAKTLTKEMLEISIACGHEHPCQFTMDDVDVATGGNNHTRALGVAYDYQKVTVPFENIEKLVNCPYLGG